MPIIDSLFDALLVRQAPDLHLAAGFPPLLRTRGGLVPLGEDPITAEGVEQLVFELLDRDQRARLEEQGDLDFAHGYGDRGRFRVNCHREFSGLGAVFRSLPARHLDEEGDPLPPGVLALADREAGLVLVAGAAGSGKTTTMARMISHINHTRPAHVLTIEDPVEFVHKPDRCLITHREIGRDTATVEDALESARREHAEVVLFSSLEDAAVMRFALDLALGGTLVFGSVRAGGGCAAAERVLDVLPAAEQSEARASLAAALAGIVSPRLFERADSSGRVAAFEVVVVTPTVAAVIRESRWKDLPALQRAEPDAGMLTIDTSLRNLIANGVVAAGSDHLAP